MTQHMYVYAPWLMQNHGENIKGICFDLIALVNQDTRVRSGGN